MRPVGLNLPSHYLLQKPKHSSISCSLFSLSMDPLSTSVSTLKASPLPPTKTNHEIFYHLNKIPYATVNRSPQAPPYVSSTSIPNLVPKTKPPPFSHKCSSTSLPFTPSKASPLKTSSPIFYTNPSTGYAAAVIDVAQSSNTLHLVQKDVHRLLKFLQHVKFQSAMVEPSMVEKVMRDVAEKGKFHRHLVALLKMLLKKNKVGMVQEVLEEFERIYDELCGTQVVLVSSKTKMGEHEVFGIAKSVQQLSGAVRVKVRNLVQESLPSFAV